MKTKEQIKRKIKKLEWLHEGCFCRNADDDYYDDPNRAHDYEQQIEALKWALR